jgi:hypothetical protein
MIHLEGTYEAKMEPAFADGRVSRRYGEWWCYLSDMSGDRIWLGGGYGDE